MKQERENGWTRKPQFRTKYRQIMSEIVSATAEMGYDLGARAEIGQNLDQREWQNETSQQLHHMCMRIIYILG